MMSKGEIAVAVLIFAALLALDLLATRAILKDDLSERRQRVAQFVLVWLVPLIGALLVLAVHRRAEKPLGKYPEPRDGDPESPGISATLVVDALKD